MSAVLIVAIVVAGLLYAQMKHYEFMGSHKKSTQGDQFAKEYSELKSQVAALTLRAGFNK